MHLQETRVVCEERTGQVCVVLFEAFTLGELGQALAQWEATHPQSLSVSFSHAAETRWEPGASLAGPRPVTVYTGMLLVRAGRSGRESVEEHPVLYETPTSSPPREVASSERK
jgi:hypothetical protein